MIAVTEKKQQARLDLGLPQLTAINTKVIKSQAAFDKLFFEYDFTKMRAITYVASAQVLMKYIDKGYQQIEIVVGKELFDDYKKSLAKEKKIDIEDLISLVQNGRLKIFGATRPIHTKLYILEGDDIVRVIQGSPNLTKTARKAHQINYCWYVDFFKHDKSVPKFLKQITKDYNAHLGEYTYFMQDLVNELTKTEPERHEEIIQVWLEAELKSEDAEITRILDAIGQKAVLITEDDASEESLIQIEVDQSPSIQKRLNKELARFNANIKDNVLSVDRTLYLDQRNHPLPIMQLDFVNKRVMLGINGKVHNRTAKDIDKHLLDLYLQNIENYMGMIEQGIALNPKITKMFFFEALMYMFTSPFFNQYQESRLKYVGKVHKRGPRYLYLYGSTQNGKTAFIDFAMKLISGQEIESAHGRDMTADGILNARLRGTVFPMVFDDLPPGKFRQKINSILKTYWEKDWRPGMAYPQPIFTSNTPKVPPWAATRMMKIEFNVLFDSNDEQSAQMLNTIRSQNNQLFTYFSRLYFEALEADEGYHNDELYHARNIVVQLYGIAGRKLPGYFPKVPAEQIYDTDREQWHNLVYNTKQARIKKKRNELHITFDDGMLREVASFRSMLPTYIKSKSQGTLLIIENPADFNSWFHRSKVTRSIIDRLRRKRHP